MNIAAVVGHIVDTMQVREEEGKLFGVVVMAEGLAEYLPDSYLQGVPRDEHGHISIAKLSLNRTFAQLIGDEYRRRTGKAAG